MRSAQQTCKCLIILCLIFDICSKMPFYSFKHTLMQRKNSVLLVLFSDLVDLGDFWSERWRDNLAFLRSFDQKKKHCKSEELPSPSCSNCKQNWLHCLYGQDCLYWSTRFGPQHKFDVFVVKVWIKSSFPHIVGNVSVGPLARRGLSSWILDIYYLFEVRYIEYRYGLGCCTLLL